MSEVPNNLETPSETSKDDSSFFPSSKFKSGDSIPSKTSTGEPILTPKLDNLEDMWLFMSMQRTCPAVRIDGSKEWVEAEEKIEYHPIREDEGIDIYRIKREYVKFFEDTKDKMVDIEIFGKVEERKDRYVAYCFKSRHDVRYYLLVKIEFLNHEEQILKYLQTFDDFMELWFCEMDFEDWKEEYFNDLFLNFTKISGNTNTHWNLSSLEDLIFIRAQFPDYRMALRKIKNTPNIKFDEKIKRGLKKLKKMAKHFSGLGISDRKKPSKFLKDKRNLLINLLIIGICFLVLIVVGLLFLYFKEYLTSVQPSSKMLKSGVLNAVSPGPESKLLKRSQFGVGSWDRKYAGDSGAILKFTNRIEKKIDREVQRMIRKKVRKMMLNKIRRLERGRGRKFRIVRRGRDLRQSKSQGNEEQERNMKMGVDKSAKRENVGKI